MAKWGTAGQEGRRVSGVNRRSVDRSQCTDLCACAYIFGAMGLIDCDQKDSYTLSDDTLLLIHLVLSTSAQCGSHTDADM